MQYGVAINLSSEGKRRRKGKGRWGVGGGGKRNQPQGYHCLAIVNDITLQSVA